ncbi:MAG TPA: SufS family cysteine desulfurase [Candidatus Norongarragalinales archaeon]|jgi:cysteine desulfurase/selenocysteine lyase|nr:SufS family cysteine desulfurase [Candidatus Norongarragalinales archaeon]
MIDPQKIKQDFPILAKKDANGRTRVYLDSTATSQKPKQVLQSIANYYESENANPHRGVYDLSEAATDVYEKAREKVARFIGANSAKEIIFVRNTTEALNLVARSYGQANVNRGDRIVSTTMEHHSNLVPWFQLRDVKQLQMEFLDFDANGQLRPSDFSRITQNTKIVTATAASNVLGTINDVREIARQAHDKKAVCVIDAAQLVPHAKVDVKKLECDFLAFSGHKMLAPMNIGVLWAREELLQSMPPFLGGGDMIREVHLSGATYADAPAKFEAGTQNVEGAAGLSAAIDYLENIGMENVQKHEQEITRYALEKLQEINGVEIYGPKNATQRAGLIAFNFGDAHSHDLAQALFDKAGVCVRSGHHCTMPLHERLGITSSARASFYVYTTKQDIDALADGLRAVKPLFSIK